MKLTLRNSIALLLALGLTFGTDLPAMGEDHSSGPGDHSGDPGDGGDGEHGHGEHGHGGDHHHMLGFMLQPTAGAPAGSAGWVVVDSNATAPAVRVATVGLAVGTYTASVTNKLEARVTVLGRFDVAAPAVSNDPSEEDHRCVLTSFPLPAGFDPANIASVQIADASGVTLLAGNNQPPSGHPGGPDHEHQRFTLQPTADAPAGAGGHAEIEAEDTTTSLKIETKGLVAGTYTVNVISLADGSVKALGTFDVAAPAANAGEDSETETAIPFPHGANPQDVASVQVVDAAGVVLLTGDGSVKGGHVEGSEHLHEKVVLTATTDAPAGTVGSAEIEAKNHEGATGAVLEIRTHGLAAGTYTASVTSIADGSVTVLGTFDVTGTKTSGDGEVEFGSEAGLAFPAGFNPLDVASVKIADANGVVLLTGDFSNVAAVATTTFSAKVRVTPGTAAPKAKGTASAAATVRSHVLRQTFTLAATGAPANAILTIVVNGANAGTVKSGRTGSVVVRKLPKGMLAHKISSVVIQNAAGTRVLSAHF